MALPQQGFRQNAGSGSQLTNITIQNTLYVMKNGNDSTAIPNRLDKPYLTINSATQNANIGDTIYVFSGSYNEGVNDIFGDGIFYYLEEGVNVICDTKVISDFGVAREINIEGFGVFNTITDSEGVVYMTNSDSVLNLTCKQIVGNGDAIVCTGEFNINANLVSSDESVGIYLSDTLGSGQKTFGTINVENLIVSSGLSAIKIEQCNSDLVERNLFLNYNLIDCDSSNETGIAISDNNSTKIYFHAQLMKQGVSESIMTINQSQIFINNSSLTGGKDGILVSGNTTSVYISNSNLITDTKGLFFDNQSCCQINNSYLKSNSLPVINLSDSSELYLSDSICVVETSSYIIEIDDTTSFRLKNTQMIGDSLTTDSIYSSTATSIFVYGQSSTNKNVNANITNQVTGTNIVVDSDIVENTNNFF